MKNFLLLLTFFYIANLNAQEVNLRTMTREERIRYVSQEATRALDNHLYELVQDVYGKNMMRPSYSAFKESYAEVQVSNQEEINDFYELYGDFVTDYILEQGDYIYNISFVANQRLWKPLLYRVSVLNNGKALSITILKAGYGKIIYNKL
ncbi:hypothetical protein [Myroides odoratus]|uniref:Uncharacterized protein n=1 Tax=Myroides odoratus TaxID=256 RepID=A0A378U4B3_MYROD|nr:hypothetical protein [Myroides odoratus]QQU02662.1 hypothetical protein I6I89_12605 [Myroides odoratus]STZ70119.1 Uncharacterised protein [Myroides odoratus]